MSEEKPERMRIGVPKYYYWAKTPPKPSPYQSTKFVNDGQKKFYWMTVAFTVAKVLAIIAVFLLMLGAL